MTLLTTLLQFVVLPALALTTPSLADVTVEALQNGQPVTTVTTSGATLVTEVHYIGLDEYSVPTNTEIRFSGKNLAPSEDVIVSIPEANLEQVIAVQPDGTWQSTIPSIVLPPGTVYAAMRTADGVNESDPLTIAEFTVQKTESLSSATWLFLITTSIAIIALLLAITLQLRYNLRHHPVI